MEASHWNWNGIIAIGIVLVIAGGAIGFGLGVWQAPNVNPDLAALQVDPRSEYHRGAWDVCVNFLMTAMKAPMDEAKDYCTTRILPTIVENDWYGEESPGYVP